MASQSEIVETEGSLSLAQRRAFLALPVEERRRKLAEQAERMVEHYESKTEQTERDEWQGGDIVEY